MEGENKSCGNVLKQQGTELGGGREEDAGEKGGGGGRTNRQDYFSL